MERLEDTFEVRSRKIEQTFLKMENWKERFEKLEDQPERSNIWLKEVWKDKIKTENRMEGMSTKKCPSNWFPDCNRLISRLNDSPSFAIMKLQTSGRSSKLPDRKTRSHAQAQVSECHVTLQQQRGSWIMSSKFRGKSISSLEFHTQPNYQSKPPKKSYAKTRR